MTVLTEFNSYEAGEEITGGCETQEIAIAVVRNTIEAIGGELISVAPAEHPTEIGSIEIEYSLEGEISTIYVREESTAVGRKAEAEAELANQRPDYLAAPMDVQTAWDALMDASDARFDAAPNVPFSPTDLPEWAVWQSLRRREEEAYAEGGYVDDSW
jgi:hypothetical protein